MPVSVSHNSEKHWQRRTSAEEWLRFAGWAALVALFVFAWHVMTKDTMWPFVLDAPRQFADMASRMFPPRWSYINTLWKPL